MGRFSAHPGSTTAATSRKGRRLLLILLALVLVTGQVTDASAQGKHSLEEIVIDLLGGGRSQSQGRAQTPVKAQAQPPGPGQAQAVQQGNFRAPAVIMEAYDDKGASLADGVPLYYAIANAPAQGLAGVPIISKHSGASPQAFTPDLGGQTFLGIYVPTGYIARYRAEAVNSTGGECRNLKPSGRGDWQAYDIPTRSRSALSPLMLGGKGGELPVLAKNQCLVVQWRMNPVQGYAGNTRQLIEQPTAAKNGIFNLPATKTIESTAPGPDGGSISLSVAEGFGGIPRELKVKAGGREYISLLHNLGAPTDDGMIWGIAMSDAVGLYGQSDAPSNLGSSQFCGHADAGTRFSGSMWGMYMPLELRGSTVTPARQCGGEPCFVPMLSDWTSATDEYGGTFPFFLPRSVQPWDGQVSKISIEPYRDGKQANTGIARLTYSLGYRAHNDFSAVGMNPHLWFGQALTDAERRDAPRAVNVYLIHVDGQVTSLPYEALANPDSSQTWDAFCGGDDYKRHCGINPKRKNDVTCQCSYSKPEVKRVVYDYFKDNVAVALSASGKGFQKLVVAIQYMVNTKGRPSLLTSVSNTFKETKEGYRVSQPVTTDTYYLDVGTLANFKKAGLMQ